MKMTQQKTKKQRFRLRKKAPEGFFTAKQTADFLGVSVRSVYRYIHLHGLPASKPGGLLLIRKADLEDWIQANG